MLSHIEENSKFQAGFESAGVRDRWFDFRDTNLFKPHPAFSSPPLIQSIRHLSYHKTGMGPENYISISENQLDPQDQVDP
jgi:hypothetical protein